MSSFAGNPLLISIDLLIKDGFLKKENIQSIPKFKNAKVDFEKVDGKTITGAYNLKGSRVYDSALRFTANMFIHPRQSQ